MFRKKKKQFSKLYIGVETKRCSECHGQQRCCLVDGAPALFHRFVDNDRGVLHIKSFVRPSEMSNILENFNKNNFTGPDCNIEKIRSTMALVEWPDGRLCTVAVERVQFTDRGRSGNAEK